MNVRTRLGTLGLAVALTLAGCATDVTDGAESLHVDSSTSSSATTPKNGTSEDTTSDETTVEATTADTTSSGDGLVKLEEVREIAESNMPTGDIWSTSVTATDTSVEAVMAENQKPHAGADDDEYDVAEAATISLNGISAEASVDGVATSDGLVTINSAGTFIFSGDFDGQVVVETEDEGKVRIVLDGVDISSPTDAAIRVTSADEVVVITAEGTENSLSDTSSYSSEDLAGGTGAIASSADLTIGGSGILNVTGNYSNGISSSDGLVILGGTINVISVDDGIRGKDYVAIADGTINISASGDGVQSTNSEDVGRGYFWMGGGSLTVTGANKGIDAVTDIVVDGGTLNLSSAGDTVEAAYILLASGSGMITSGDDGVNGTSDSGTPWVSISGGDWTLNADGDGFDSNGDAHMSGGTMTVFGPTNSGNGAIDVQNGMTISGGTLFAAGSVGMDEAPTTSSDQSSIKYQATGTVGEGSVITVQSPDGTTIGTWTLPKQAQSFVVSSADISAGETYTVIIDGSTAGTAVAGEYQESAMGGGPGGSMQGGGGRPGF